ncbi:ribosomal-processing cysteine protease Prp [Ligaoa zhengdingensis]|uniref:ribosomal-processing cysteine protease Prp n=1 Tax=Ligaoa zhengdingensis TaxID=2763658 RepID=UPI0031BA60B1
MITAKFRFEKGRCSAFAVSGHAMFADFGQDIVCASVSSALQLTVNGITEVLKLPADIWVAENEISLSLSGQRYPAADPMLSAFYLQMQLLAEDYPNHIQLITSEV